MLVTSVSMVYHEVLQYFNVSISVHVYFQILVTEATKKYYLKVIVAEEVLEKLASDMAESGRFPLILVSV